MNSPWGDIQHTDPIAPGVMWVDTAGHGGLCLTAAVAEQRLTKMARRRAIVQDNCCWYEEDCLWAIVAFELPDLWPTMFRGSPIPDAERRTRLLHTISSYDADYLVERRIEPEPDGFAYWLWWKLQDVLRQIRQSNAAAAQALIPDLNLIVEIEGGCCCSVRPDTRSTMFLRQLGMDFHYQVNDHDILEEKIS